MVLDDDPAEEIIEEISATEEKKQYAIELVKIYRYLIKNEEYDNGVGLSILWSAMIDRYKQQNNLSSTKEIKLPGLTKKNSAKKLLAEFKAVFCVDDNQIVTLTKECELESERSEKSDTKTPKKQINDSPVKNSSKPMAEMVKKGMTKKDMTKKNNIVSGEDAELDASPDSSMQFTFDTLFYEIGNNELQAAVKEVACLLLQREPQKLKTVADQYAKVSGCRLPTHLLKNVSDTERGFFNAFSDYFNLSYDVVSINPYFKKKLLQAQKNEPLMDELEVDHKRKRQSTSYDKSKDDELRNFIRGPYQTNGKMTTQPHKEQEEEIDVSDHNFWRTGMLASVGTVDEILISKSPGSKNKARRTEARTSENRNDTRSHDHHTESWGQGYNAHPSQLKELGTEIEKKILNSYKKLKKEHEVLMNKTINETLLELNKYVEMAYKYNCPNDETKGILIEGHEILQKLFPYIKWLNKTEAEKELFKAAFSSILANHSEKVNLNIERIFGESIEKRLA